MSKKTFSIFALILLLLLVSGVGSYYFLQKSSQNINPKTKTELSDKNTDDILKQIDEKNEIINKNIQKAINETDFDPETASPKEIVNKIEKLEKIQEETEAQLE